MKELRYQQRAVHDLVEKTIELLCLTGHRKQLVFKAPTGAGKTMMASQMLNELTEELQSRGDCPYQRVAYVWIAPNKLHQQSYFKMKEFFGETHLLRPVMYDELDQSDGYIHSGEILFVNWESINKEKNVMVRESEQNLSIFEIARRTQEEHGVPIVVVIDEEHLFWSKTADKSKKVLEQMMPKVEIRISATPKTHSDYTVVIPREKVIDEEMIKRQVIMNPDIAKGFTDESELNQHLIAKALEKRNQLAEAYRKVGANINPLLLIQLPNDTSETMSSEDLAIAEQVKTYLRVVKGITEENGRLAIWLSKEKANLPHLEAQDNLAEVLLFKQAIALGWDCPRAAVLLIFRKLQSDTFTIQTVGRILRMPEQKHYAEELLNVGYVYTDISKDKIQIVAEDMDYLYKDVLQAVRRDQLVNVELTSFYSERKSSDRNRLGPDYKKVLINCFVRNWVVAYQPSFFSFDGDGEENTSDMESVCAKNRKAIANRINLDVKNVNVEIPSDVVFQNELGVIDTGERKKFARSAGELHRIYIDFCRSLLGKFEKAHSTDVLAGYLLAAMEDLFELFETDAKKVILYHANKPKFVDIIQKSLDVYGRLLQGRKNEARQREFEAYKWEVPADRLYKESTNHIMKEVEDHALLPFIELNQASTPEQRFRDFLEKNKEYIDWWYKNGDEGKQHYSVPYTNSQGERALFYVNFVIRMKNGQVFLFDTKTENSDAEAPNKHNGLIDYLKQYRQDGVLMDGGVIIGDGDLWRYSDSKIENTSNTAGWKAFFPEEYKV